MGSSRYSYRNVIAGYIAVYTLFTLAASLIWAINTIFLIREGGLSIFQVMIVNAVFTVGQMTFEIPTGVVADTIGRRASLILCMGTLMISTLLYVLTPRFGLGILGFVLASILLGLGFTFQTGALDAWVVDALDAVGWTSPKERVFAWGQMSSGAGLLAGSLLGGVIGQIGLVWPYVIRAALLGAAGFAVAILIRDVGFTRRPFRVSTFRVEAQRIFGEGVRFGWRSPVVKPLLWVSLLTGVFLMYGWYAWQPYVLALVDRDFVWLLGVVQSLFALAGIAGNALVRRVMREGGNRRHPADVLFGAALLQALLTLGIALVGVVGPAPGPGPATVAIVLWLFWGLVYGLITPVRMSYINSYIPSAQRATVLSMDALFVDAGGAIGQPALGWVSERASIPIAWLIGAGFMGVGAFFYRVSGRSAERVSAAGTPPAPDTAS